MSGTGVVVRLASATVPFRASIRLSRWIEPGVVFVTSLAVRLGYSQPNAHFDEFYHILAAESLLERGKLAIADGQPYTRGWLFTYLVAGSYRLFGESIWAARFPSVIAGALLAAGVFAWTRHNVDRTSAWISALMMCFSALAIHYSIMSRFYMTQALCVWLAAAAVYQLLTGRPSRMRTSGLLALAISSALVAIHMQITSLIPLAAIAGWSAVTLLGRILRRRRGPRERAWVIGAAFLIGLACLGIGVSLGLHHELLARHRDVALWASPHRDDLRYYYDLFRRFHPTLWILSPIVLVVSLGRNWKPALYCWAIFATALVAHSTAGMKAPRYVTYALPFFFVPCGMALARLVLYLRDELIVLTARVSLGRAPARWIRKAAWIGAVTLLLFSLRFAPDFYRTPQLLNRKAVSPFTHRDWTSAGEALTPTLERYEVVLTSASPKGLYHLRRSDIGISVTELGGDPEFSIDPRVGRPLISTVTSLERVIAQHDSGLIVLEDGHWRDWRFISEPVSDYIEQNLERLDVSGDVLVFRWNRSQPVVDQN